MPALFLLATLLGDVPPAEAETAPDLRQVVSRGLAFLDAGGAELEKGAACVNCHHAPLRGWALRDASRAGIDIDAKALDEATEAQVQFVLKRKDEYRGMQWGHSLSSWYLLGGLKPDADAMPADVADELARIVLAEQGKDGRWKAAQQFANERRPKKDADEVQTMWSLLALSRRESIDGVKAARDRALEWLATTEHGTTIDARSLRLVVEHRFGKPEKAEQLAAKLVESQHADGGWGWQPDDPSEAWPAGMALFALTSLGDKAPRPAIEKAQAFLAKTQKDDGSWFVEGKLTKNAKMSSYFGTAWAIIGLSSTLPVEKATR